MQSTKFMLCGTKIRHRGYTKSNVIWCRHRYRCIHKLGDHLLNIPATHKLNVLLIVHVVAIARRDTVRPL